ncbi:MAG: tetratricopeptide repeat protein [Chloroflexi bacterium]|nr:tetratricopeptide repeat protein [Chloroflexota bacterium]
MTAEEPEADLANRSTRAPGRKRALRLVAAIAILAVLAGLTVRLGNEGSAPTAVSEPGSASPDLGLLRGRVPSARPSAGIASPLAVFDPGAQTQADISRLLATIEGSPDDGEAYRDLGFTYLQRARDTGDPSSYPAAEEAFRQAAQRSPDDSLTLVGQTGLQLARHEFTTALETGTAAMKAAPGNRAAQAVVVDALVELGRYDEAVKVAAMLLEADSLPAWNRTSYLRELHGDLKGALKAMEEAAVRGGGVPENEAFTFTLVGNLNAALGRQDRATIVFDKALAFFPNYGPAIAGKARLAIAQGDLAEGVRLFEKAVAILPLPEYVIALGEAQEASGDLEAARKSYDLATFQVKLFQANGVVVDVELALFEADHGAADKALEYARASYENRQNVKTADTLAWALYRNGDLDGAAKYSAEALRLGSKDPILLYHAGAIAAARGDKATARKQLEGALAIDAGFSATGAEHARSILEGLD